LPHSKTHSSGNRKRNRRFASFLFIPTFVITPPPATHLTYRKGPLLTNVEVFTLSGGTAWQTPPYTQLSQKMNASSISSSPAPLLTQLAEYSVPGKAIGTASASAQNSDDPSTGKNRSRIRHSNPDQNELTNGTLPPSNANSLYFVFLPPGGPRVRKLVASTKLQGVMGYRCHPRRRLLCRPALPRAARLHGRNNGLAGAHATSSHELCEAITDPIPGQGW